MDKANRFRFRAWDKRFNKMHYELNIAQDDQNILDCSLSDDYVLMQSTGLLDKNEKEIFEGDIVQDVWTRRDDSPIQLWQIKFQLWQIKFGDHLTNEDYENASLAYGWYGEKISGGLIDNKRALCQLYEPLVVVGNIHENPELLKNGDCAPINQKEP